MISASSVSSKYCLPCKCSPDQNFFLAHLDVEIVISLTVRCESSGDGTRERSVLLADVLAQRWLGDWYKNEISAATLCLEWGSLPKTPEGVGVLANHALSLSGAQDAT